MNYILSPSILSADMSRLADVAALTEKAGAGYLHLDVMDGMFVPNMTFGPPVIKALRSKTSAVFDVHLMIEEPSRYITEFAEAGADIITVHYEASRHLDRTIDAIRDAGKKCGVVLNPATPVELLTDILGKLDMVLLMSVNPGFGNQKYIPYVTGKIRKLRSMIDTRSLSVDIEVDGGVSPENIAMLMDAGANVFVAGSAVYSGDATVNIHTFLRIIKEHEKTLIRSE